MRGSPNFVDTFSSGDPLPSALVDDLVDIVVSAGDDALFDIIPIDPPALASDTNVNVGFIPLRLGYPVVGDAAARQVTVKPVRVVRSSTTLSLPRGAASAVSAADTVVAQPAAAGPGLWGLDLLYARLQYADAANPPKGLTVTFLFATPAAYLSTAGAPGIAALPANSSGSWNVPLAYVKNVNGATTVPQSYVLDVPAGVVSSTNLGNLRNRFAPHRARRAYSSANNALAALVTGGSSQFNSASDRLTSTQTPAVLGRQGIDFETREILIPPQVTGGTSGVLSHTVIDDTRDWRGANFLSFWTIAADNTRHFGEDDPGLGSTITVQPTQMDGLVGAPALFQSVGQSHVAIDPAGSGGFSSFNGGSALWAANVGYDVSNSPSNGVTQPVPTGNVVGLTVDASTGTLKFSRKHSGVSAGPAIYIVLFAFFSRAR
jgi:hypothetical protein